MHGTYALIPIKGFERGKSRLTPRLGASERSALARSMFDHVLGLCLSSPRLAGTLVATDSPEIARLASARGALALADPPAAAEPRGARLALVIDAGLAALRERSAAAALVLMADLPRIGAADVAELLQTLEGCDVVLASDSRGRCTNALGLRLGEATRFPTAFGDADSLVVHEQRARALGLCVRRCSNPRLAQDLDLPADLDVLVRSGEDG